MYSRNRTVARVPGRLPASIPDGLIGAALVGSPRAWIASSTGCGALCSRHLHGGDHMSHRSSSLPSPRSLVWAAAVLGLAACGGEASKYSGTWSRDLYGEGEVQMNLASNGNMELMLPSPRWPDSVDIKSRANFMGDTLMFKADTTASPCQSSDARYVVSRTEDELHIAGVGMDNCGGRRAALVGTWKKS
jgi:hypothetical protein